MKPSAALVVKWRELAAEGRTYADIQREHPDFTEDQVRHYCVGTAGKGLPGPLQEPGRWGEHNHWLQGDASPNAQLTEEQARAVLDDWDERRGTWATPGTEWAARLGVSSSTIYMLRRGETWAHLEHPNAGRRPGRRSA